MPPSTASSQQPPEVPSRPLEVLQIGLDATRTAIDAGLDVVELTEAPMDAINLGIGKATNAISQALPSFPAATMGMMVVGMPHAHLHPPSCIPPAPPVPLPVLGTIALGCCVSVLINGIPAARVGDLGINPTCCGLGPMFEIFTGSSKVFIGGMRAARAPDVTMHCWPPKSWLARGAVAGLVKAANAGMAVMDRVQQAGQALQVADHVVGGAQAAVDGDTATAKAHVAALGMMAVEAAAQAASDAIAMAMGALMGKDPAIGSPVGAIVTGHPNVLIGGFPMPSGMQIARRKLGSATFDTKPPGKNPDGQQGPGQCPS